MWRSLFWKEWREQRWKAAFNTLLVTAFVAIGLRARVVPDEVILAMAWMVTSIILPLFVSIGLFAVETVEGTYRFLNVLPEKRWRVFTTKMLMGGLVVILPFICSVLTAIMIAHGREMSLGYITGLNGMFTWIGIQAFVWFLVVGMNQATEARAGLAGIMVFTSWCVLVSLLGLLRIPENSMTGKIIFSITPFGTLPYWESPFSLTGSLGFVIFNQIIVMTGLCSWGYFGYSHEKKSRR